MRIPQAVAQRSAQHLVPGALAATGAAFLTVKAVRTVGPDPYSTMDPAAAAPVAVVALLGFGAAAASVGGLAAARPLILTALAGALLVDWLPAGPPRLVYLLPLVLAAGLLFATPVPDPTTGSELQAAGPPGSRRGGRSPLRQGPGWAVALGWLGIALHAAVGYLYLVSGLVAPAYGVVLLWALWTGLLVVALRLRRSHRAWTPLVPLVALAVWIAVLHAGGALLGWQA